MAFFTLQVLGPLFAGIYSLGLGIFVLRTNKNNASYRYFFILTIAVAVWSVFVAIFHLPLVQHDLWNLLHWITGFFIAPAYLLFLINFPHSRNIIPNIWSILIWTGTALMVAVMASWPEKFILSYSGSINEVPRLVVGPFAWIFDVYIALYLGSGFLFAIHTLFRTYGRNRANMLTGLIGLGIATSGAVFTNVVLAVHFGIELIWLGPIFAFIGPTSLAYMLLGLKEGRPSLLPALSLGGAVLFALAYQTVVSQTIASSIFQGALLAGTTLLAIFLVRITLLESADLSRFQAVTKKLERANAHLLRADQIKSEFLSIVSHHLRTPLTQIKWSLNDLLKGDYGTFSNPRQKKLVVDLVANNERLMKFVNALLDTSRIESGKMTLEQERISTEPFIKDIIKNAADNSGKYYRVSIELVPANAPIPDIYGDKELLRKALENILENAVVYNRPGGKAYVELETANQHLVIKIADTGIGIPNEDLASVGIKFYRPKFARKHVAEGTGLGIFVAKHIVHLHKGSLDISSKKDKGTTVTIKLPLT